jgi:hypothetical protein
MVLDEEDLELERDGRFAGLVRLLLGAHDAAGHGERQEDG